MTKPTREDRLPASLNDHLASQQINRDHETVKGCPPAERKFGQAHLLFGTGDGPLRGPLHQPALADGEAMLLATDPESGRMAVTLDFTRRLVVLDADLQVLGERILEQAEAYHGWFCGPDTLVTFGMFSAIRSWRIEDGELVVEGHTWLSKDDIRYDNYSWPLGLSPLPSRKSLAFARVDEPPSWYDARTLTPVPAPAVFGDRFPLWMSPRDRYALIPDRPRVTKRLEVIDVPALEVARLVTTPINVVTIAELDMVDTGSLAAGALTVFDLLRDCAVDRLTD